jgi:hypothetical protein
MTIEEARALRPGDRFRLLPLSGWRTHPPDRTEYVVAHVEQRADSSVRILTVDGFRFWSWEVERIV